MLALAALALAGQLRAARIEVVLGGGAAAVTARYTFAAAGDSVRFVLIRRPDQRVTWDRRSPPSTRDQPGLIAATVLPAGDGGAVGMITLRYTARGRLARIPIPVPDQPTAPGPARVRLAVRGLPPGARLGEGFPRLRPAAEGTAEAELAHVPSLVRLPPNAGRVSAGRAMEWLVGLLAAGGAALGVVRARRSREGLPGPKAAP